ncbi:MAG TPA: chemotaxis protein CheW [Spirochaetales bacterium]|nr:chemotaxis protein CheW [Spirochaetales bacterium]HRY53403.1 chemotaxis protein CheW [Spirochaetia bacterium]HRZ63545.1 chemotaxis protein CheW [Spirochaetia bacterium]
MGNYLTFTIAGESCAVEVRDVETVLEKTELGRISGVPGYVAGLLDLRGEAIPVIDVRRKLGLDPGEATRDQCIIVLAMGGSGARRPVGALVDSVSEVVEIPDGAIAASADFAVRFDRAIVRGIARLESGFVTMIEAERLFEAPPTGA